MCAPCRSAAAADTRRPRLFAASSPCRRRASHDKRRNVGDTAARPPRLADRHTSARLHRENPNSKATTRPPKARRRANKSPTQVCASSGGRGATSALDFFWRTRVFSIRTKHATISRLRTQQRAASGAIIKPLAGVGRHFRRFARAALRASQKSVDDDFWLRARQNRIRRRRRKNRHQREKNEIDPRKKQRHAQSGRSDSQKRRKATYRHNRRADYRSKKSFWRSHNRIFYPLGAKKNLGGVLLSHGQNRTTIGDETFHGPVRDGKGWVHLSMAAKKTDAPRIRIRHKRMRDIKSKSGWREKRPRRGKNRRTIMESSRTVN